MASMSSRVVAVNIRETHLAFHCAGQARSHGMPLFSGGFVFGNSVAGNPLALVLLIGQKCAMLEIRLQTGQNFLSARTFFVAR